ncbi:LRR receptor-like serine/threonine-protein kinase ER2 isoform X2 [Populus nigra]|uniref:LRR receptor-like serine/threonine-protein kinase ER2 isoform X2 n=1 Tax=Populus nigra TaxID=3691 RepID=UPI002B27AFDB|nr:LRR receptor-like serine/threonine-protein kinase ER2 isoform X2 [Populus nigra]
MSWHAHNTRLLLLSCFLLSCSVVFCQLSKDQDITMITLSKLLNNTASPWDATKEPNPCSWIGVRCSPDNTRVTHLFLSGIGLSSSDFIPVICKIESLQWLDFSNNRLSSIPDEFINVCGQISELQTLSFSHNSLAGPLPTFHGFEGLETLDLSCNSMSGNISLQLDGFRSLKSLNLSSNKFNGHVPINLGKSMMLEELQLSVNSFQGSIPSEIVSYQNLHRIDLSANQLSGSIPDVLGNLTYLEVLVLSSNKLSGEIPTSLSNIQTLQRFAANENNFYGGIPCGLTRFLTYLDLSYNRLAGLIPPDFLSQPNVQTLDLSYNMLEGSIPSNVSRNLVILKLGSNRMNGSIPVSFEALTNLTHLELENNSLTGVIPPQLSSCGSLVVLNLAQNNLIGALPAELDGLYSLEVMKLQLNKLSGLDNLDYLNLQGNNLSGSIPDSMPSVVELQLGQNQLSGRIPKMPVRLQTVLNLSSNLFEGPIPSDLSQLMGLKVLDLSNNKFSGAGGYTYLFEPLWWIGMITMIAGEIANFAAYAFAPAILVTPLGALSIIISAALAHAILQEKLHTFGILGCALCVVGSTTIVLHAPQEREIESVKEVWDLATEPAFLLYAAIVITAAVVIIIRVIPHYGQTHVMVYISICSLMGSLSVMSVKALGIALKLTFSGMNQLLYPQTWAFTLIVLACVITQINYLNKALDTFNAAVVSPIYYVMFTSLTILASVIMFKDWDGKNASQIVTEICGFVTILSGTFLLHETKDMVEGSSQSSSLRLPKHEEEDEGLDPEGIPLRQVDTLRPK